MPLRPEYLLRRLMLTLLYGTMVLSGSSASARQSDVSPDRLADADYVFVGEIHGSNESPQYFLSLLEQYVRNAKPCVVALEVSRRQGELMNALIHAPADQAAARRAEMLADPFWTTPGGVYDGRASTAMLKLIDALAQLAKRPGTVLAIIGFQSATDQEAAQYIHRQLERYPGAGLMSLSGNVHARNKPLPWMKGSLPMPAYFPAERRLSINLLSAGGQAWNCDQDGCGSRDLGSAPAYPACETACLIKAENQAAFDLLYAIGSVTAAQRAVVQQDIRQ